MTDPECVAFLQWALPRLGLRWPGFRRVRRQVCKRISRRITELGLSGARAYRTHLEADPAEWSVLDSFCWISVSRFSRDRGVFAHLARRALPELAHGALARERRVLGAWSAGCASGEEPYSLRLAWDLAAAPTLPEAELRILATDASPTLLARAVRGIYPGSALKELPAAWRSSAFESCDGSYRLREEFRSRVEFRREDIREHMPTGPFDLILCRNLAFTYFEEGLQREILDRLVKRLVPGGALLVGAHESLPAHDELVRAPELPALYRRPSRGRVAGGVKR
jgi:chemotaxis protein methyltransferase CheR